MQGCEQMVGADRTSQDHGGSYSHRYRLKYDKFTRERMADEKTDMAARERGFDLYRRGPLRRSSPRRRRPQEGGCIALVSNLERSDSARGGGISAAPEKGSGWGMRTVNLKADDGSVDPEEGRILEFMATASPEELSELRQSLSVDDGGTHRDGLSEEVIRSVSSLNNDQKAILMEVLDGAEAPVVEREESAASAEFEEPDGKLDLEENEGRARKVAMKQAPSRTLLRAVQPERSEDEVAARHQGISRCSMGDENDAMRESVDVRMHTLNASLSRKTFEALKPSRDGEPPADSPSARPVSALEVLPPVDMTGRRRQDQRQSYLVQGLVTSRRSVNTTAEYMAITIPVLPRGRVLEVVIHSTWGDPNLVGLNGIELFDDSGGRLSFTRGSVASTLTPVEVLPKEEKPSGAMLMNLVREPYLTQDDMHTWLALFDPDGNQRIILDLGPKPVCLAMVRVWNYNKSRLYSARGVRNITLLLDRVPIFTGEIRQGPGELRQPRECCEHILFTDDLSVLARVEEADWLADSFENEGES
ncbi:hypothetical protein FOZ61_008032 [Perkinsus olseni]|uniref:KATNIP domain-containing protein n=1 Tax=Perkinsus olseni TaxID=32597 RepID=A0A7J6M7Z5_PEROL|nr:hypothetical protein FOZ61_008032 [Perkinsus olseni]